MDEKQKNTPQTGETPDKPTKKLSRTTLTFYIIGLFSVAIALIFISYIAQVRNDKQLENLNTKLSEQQTVAQGATQKMEGLQKQLDEMDSELTLAREALALDADKPITEEVAAQAIKRQDALRLILVAEEAARAGDTVKLAETLSSLEHALGEQALQTTAQGGLLTDEEYSAYQSLKTVTENPTE